MIAERLTMEKPIEKTTGPAPRPFGPPELRVMLGKVQDKGTVPTVPEFGQEALQKPKSDMPAQTIGERPSWGGSAIPTAQEATEALDSVKEGTLAHKKAKVTLETAQAIKNSEIPLDQLNMGVSTPVKETPTKTDDGHDNTGGRRGQHRGKFAIAMGALAAVTVAACNRLGITWPLGQPSPAPSATPAAEVSPVATETPGASVVVTEPPSASASASVGPSQTKSPTAEITTSPEQQSALKKAINEWNNKGTYDSKEPQLFHNSPADNSVLHLDCLASEAQVNTQTDPFYSGVFLGYAIVDNHAIVIMGEKDINQNPYAIALNGGNVKDPDVYVKIANNIAYFSNINGKQKINFYNFPEAASEFDKYIGQTVIFNPNTPLVGQPPDSSWDNYVNEIKAQQGISNKLNHLAAFAGHNGSYTDAPYYQELLSAGVIISDASKIASLKLPLPYLEDIYTKTAS